VTTGTLLLPETSDVELGTVITTYDSSLIERNLVVGRLDTRARYLYTNGHCHLLACVVASHLGAPVTVACMDRADPARAQIADLWNITTRDIRSTWLHAFVSLGDGRYLDVMGVHDRAGVESVWASSDETLALYLFDTSPEDLMEAVYWGAEPDRGDLVLAHALVAPLLVRFEKEIFGAD
jgi:hypothetical protein